MFSDNFVYVFFIHIGVPSGFRIHHQQWTFAASVHTTCAVNAALTLAIHVQRFDFLFGVIPHRLPAQRAAALCAIVAFIGAEKNMVFKIGHSVISIA
jgi:hypothetical protein